MLSVLIHAQTRYVAILLAAITALYAANAATAVTTINCRGTIMQSACKNAEICIDDPIRLSNELLLSLSVKKRIYRTSAVTGKIVSIGVLHGGKLDLTIDPSIQGGTKIAFSSNGRQAKLTGGDFNYFFECRNASL